jgi:hypothetical protein
MTRYLRWLAVGGVASALLVWSLVLATNGTAADEDKEVRDGILKLADAEAKGDSTAAKKQAEGIAAKVDEIAPVMDLMKPRGDGGLGVGSAPGKITPDGIEKKLIAMDKEKNPMTPAQLTAQGDALARMGEQMAAIAEVAKLKCPVKKKEGDKDPKDWAKWTDEMQKGSLEFANAAKAKDPARLKTVTRKLNSTCSECHSVFRD